MKIKDKIVTFRMRYNRGKAYFYDMKEIIYIFAGLTAYWKIMFDFKIPLWFAISVCVIAIISFYLAGTFDELKAKIWQKEAIYGTKKVNPFLRKIGIIERQNKKILKLLKNEN